MRISDWSSDVCSSDLTGYLDVAAHTIEEAMAVIDQSCAERKPVSVGLLGNAAEILPELYRRGVRPDLLTDQTSAHDPVNGYLPIGRRVADWVDRESVVSGHSVYVSVHLGGRRFLKKKKHNKTQTDIT